MTIKKSKWLWLGLCFVFLMTGCDISPKNKVPNPVQTISTSLTGENIHSITLDSSEIDVIKAFGKPASVDVTEKPKAKYLNYVHTKNDGKLVFCIINNKVERYNFSDKRYRTSRGITIGNTVEDVKKAYGKNYVERTDTDGRVMLFVDKKHKESIEFILDKGKVKNILFQKGMNLEYLKPYGAAL
jgi:hypothetical protein